MTGHHQLGDVSVKDKRMKLLALTTAAHVALFPDIITLMTIMPGFGAGTAET